MGTCVKPAWGQHSQALIDVSTNGRGMFRLVQDDDETYMGLLRNKLRYANMTEADVWADELEAGIKKCGFQPYHIIRFKDANY